LRELRVIEEQVCAAIGLRDSNALLLKVLPSRALVSAGVLVVDDPFVGPAGEWLAASGDTSTPTALPAGVAAFVDQAGDPAIYDRLRAALAAALAEPSTSSP
jgi:hypothetical protein